MATTRRLAAKRRFVPTVDNSLSGSALSVAQPLSSRLWSATVNEEAFGVQERSAWEGVPRDGAAGSRANRSPGVVSRS